MKKFFGWPLGEECELDIVRDVYRNKIGDALMRRELIAERFLSIAALDRTHIVHGIISKDILLNMIDYIRALIESELLDRDTHCIKDISDLHSRLLGELEEHWNYAKDGKLFEHIYEHLSHIEDSQFVKKAGEVARAYVKYNSHFFKGKFVDRNGKELEFSKEELHALSDTGRRMYKSVKSGGGISLDESTGQFVSKIICVLFEFVFDEVFKVPFYCKEIADTSKTLAELGSQITTTMNAIQVVEGQIGILCSSSPAICRGLESMSVRQKLLELQELDRKLFNLNKTQTELTGMVGGNYGTYAKVFTCHAAGVIVKPICNIRLGGIGNDYSALVGELTAYSATKASAYVKSAVGPAIKGAGVFSTNNEALTEIAASTLGIITKKLVEVVVFNSLEDIIQNDKISQIAHSGNNILQMLYPNAPAIEVIGGRINSQHLFDELSKLHLD